MSLPKVLIASGLMLIVLLAVWSSTMVSRTHDRAILQVNDQTLSVRVADSTSERTAGLSDYTLESLAADGMLFIFPTSEPRQFWMYHMNFDLDVVWINDGLVQEIDYAVPPPKPGQEPAKMTSGNYPADMVLELPAGRAQVLEIQAGSSIQLMNE